ncbi:MAG: GGDEF domain-containing protein [Candidatus Competibacteraceae bacterium]|nr:GGDEF domain-containing protein [Candidatus Competibacteraceae bacterium]
MYLEALMLILNTILLAGLLWRVQYFKTLALYDPLTGLPNRRLFEARLEQAIKQARRHHNLAVVLFLDSDHFKQINDTQGHPVGDQLLCAVAQRLRGCVREVDTVARRGGDEFIVLLTDLADPQAAARVAQKIITALHEPFLIAACPLQISASLGISLCTQEKVPSQQSIANADHALYEAKQQGRGHYRFFAPAGIPKMAAAGA